MAADNSHTRRILTAAHIGFLHHPDVGGALVTRLHYVHLEVTEHMVQLTLRLNTQSMEVKERFSGYVFTKKGYDEVVHMCEVNLWSSTYILVFFPPLFPTFWRLRRILKK